MRSDANAGNGPLGVYGGSFDPVHLGHLRAALEMRELLGLAAVHLLPSRTPPHRGAPQASAELRLEMLRAAVATVPEFVADDRELRRDGPSYTVDTLRSLREEFPGRSLVLLLGMDAFLGLADWHRAEELATHAHVAVMHRPGFDVPADALAQVLPGLRQARATKELQTGAGRFWVHPVTGLDISSTAIRDLVAGGGDARFLVPDAVREILQASQCYLPAAPRHGGGTG